MTSGTTHNEAMQALIRILEERAGTSVTIREIISLPSAPYRGRAWLIDKLNRAANGNDDLFPGLVIHRGNVPGRYEIERQTSDVVTPSDRK